MPIQFLRFDEQRIRRIHLVRERLNFYGDQDHQRWTFRRRGLNGRTLFYKIWNPTYVRSNTMIEAIEAGFYSDDLTPALRAVLMDESGMRGYVAAACKPRPNRDAIDQPFYERIKRRTESTGYFNYDLRPHHIMLHRGRCSLIDLEGVYRLDQLDVLEHFHSHFGDPGYERFVAELRDRHLAASGAAT